MPKKNSHSSLIGVRRSANRGPRLLRECVARHGWKRVHRGARYKGFHLGHWVITQRTHYRRGRLAPWLIRELEAIPGWSWEPQLDRHRQRLKRDVQLSLAA